LEVKLLHSTPLEIADIAICKCYGNEPHSDEAKVKARINRVANVSKHASTIETLVYSLDISGISRACLQQICRHRISSYTIKSSRYTLQELKKEAEFIREGVK
jgi:thymidylate synthase (FAD)